jgi:hypothetical protein
MKPARDMARGVVTALQVLAEHEPSARMQRVRLVAFAGHKKRTMRAMICLGAGLLLAAAASAQSHYQCRTPGGSLYFSDRPCTGQLVYGGSNETPTLAPRSHASVGDAPKYLQYMSPRCASLNDALRTASARGLKYETMNTMRRDYQAECGENERDAQSQYSRNQGMERQQKNAERQSQLVAQNQARLHEDQCEESKRILLTKRNRPDLNEGERAELKRFEENYRARCTR